MFGLPIQNKNSAINASLPFLFNYFELKKKHIRRKINRKKNVYMSNQCYYYFDLPKIKVGQAHTIKNYVAFP